MGSINAELWVEDVGEALHWYESVLGFKWVRPESRENVRHGEMKIDDSNSLVFNDTEPREGAVDAVLAQLIKGHPNGTAVVLLIELTETDIDKYYERVTANGVDVIEPLEDRFGGRSRMFRIRGPYGFILSFIKRRPAS